MEKAAALSYNRDMSIIISPAAEQRLDALRQKQGKASLFMRVTVDGGGCQGFEYQLSFADEPDDDDVFTEASDAPVGVTTDPMSMGFLMGATLDFENELVGSKFVIKNPNATSSCGCGTSFNVA